MIVTKTEFKEQFGYSSLSSVSHLLKKKTIIANSDGMIDLNQSKNKKWVKRRLLEIENKKNPNSKENEEKKRGTDYNKTEDRFLSEIDNLNQQLKIKQATLLDFKIAKEQKEVIETSVLNRVIIASFDTFFRCLGDLAGNYADEIIDIVKDNKNPRETLIEFLTDKILLAVQEGLSNAKAAAKKYYQ